MSTGVVALVSLLQTRHVHSGWLPAKHRRTTAGGRLAVQTEKTSMAPTAMPRYVRLFYPATDLRTLACF